jgi:tripeptidyl-peptidase-1|tara:strand:+ start:176 stop:358 length:183 start_codon:yes stop_codon:yes gene_type:complete
MVSSFDVLFFWFIYSSADAFNDVTQGVNNDNLNNGFTAVAGWDASTGVGTPNYAKMVKAL